MAEKMTILVGTVGQGIVRSEDGGENWQRVGINSGLHSDALVRTVVNHPDRSEVVFTGTDKGLYRSESGSQFDLLAAAPPQDPFGHFETFCSAPLVVFDDALYAGSTRDGALYRVIPR